MMTDVQSGQHYYYQRKHVLRSIHRNNKRVRNAGHVEQSKMRKEFRRTHLPIFSFFWGDGVTDVVAVFLFNLELGTNSKS